MCVYLVLVCPSACKGRWPLKDTELWAPVKQGSGDRKKTLSSREASLSKFGIRNLFQ